MKTPFLFKLIAIMILPVALEATADPIMGETNAPPEKPATEIQAAPGAILWVWKGKETSEPEITAVVDKQKTFIASNADNDPGVQQLNSMTLRWQGILNLEAGIYTFNFMSNDTDKEGFIRIKVNGKEVFVAEGAGNATKSVNLDLPGAVNVEITMFEKRQNLRMRGAAKVTIRYKKNGAIGWQGTVTPENLLHIVK
ncbi:MAG: hypothetical protein IJU44_05935 [Kiritimatiellae bacterium]|nr:hypothetical protein [Kiritimatiellia bacterium]